jgi:hypothetical protein
VLKAFVSVERASGFRTGLGVEFFLILLRAVSVGVRGSLLLGFVLDMHRDFRLVLGVSWLASMLGPGVEFFLILLMVVLVSE